MDGAADSQAVPQLRAVRAGVRNGAQIRGQRDVALAKLVIIAQQQLQKFLVQMVNMEMLKVNRLSLVHAQILAHLEIFM